MTKIANNWRVEKCEGCKLVHIYSDRLRCAKTGKQINELSLDKDCPLQSIVDIIKITGYTIIIVEDKCITLKQEKI